MANRNKKNASRHEDNRETFREYEARSKKKKPWRAGKDKRDGKRKFIDNDEPYTPKD